MKQYTYAIITTDSNKQLKFLHDRMPVVLEPGSEEMRQWLDPNSYEWTRELQALLQPFSGEVEVYAVSKDVGKVGNNSPSFIRPLYSKENKSNIANFFSSGKGEKKQDMAEDASTKPTLNITEKSLGGVKRKEPPVATVESPMKKKLGERRLARVRSTHNVGKAPVSAKGTQKITKFFSS